MSENLKYIHFKGEVITLWKNPNDKLWRSKDGTVWAYTDESFSTDPITRPGVGFFSWRSWWPGYKELTDASAPHDFEYNSPAYQAFNTRQEADDALADRIHLVAQDSGKSWLNYLAHPFKRLANIWGGRYWEDSDTR